MRSVVVVFIKLYVSGLHHYFVELQKEFSQALRLRDLLAVIVLPGGHDTRPALAREFAGLSGLSGVGQKNALQPNLERGSIQKTFDLSIHDLFSEVRRIFRPKTDRF